MYKTLIVVDNELFFTEQTLPGVVSFETYLREYPKQGEPKTRIINLCDTGQYLSRGYYCSLLAEARNHRVLPSVKTINGLKNLGVEKDTGISLRSALFEEISGDLPAELMIYFGKVDEPGLQKLANEVFSQYPAPILKISLSSESGIQCETCSFSALSDEQQVVFLQRLNEFTQTVWRVGKSKRRYRWDMAVLVNPEDKVPPSNKEAISRMVKAAKKLGINAEVRSIDQLQNIMYYDALFIRETTAIDHYTYRLATKAENSGLVVIDDSVSILRCCNKVYLHDAFSYQKVPSLKTEVISESGKQTLKQLESSFGFPLVLKMPEGSFSKGVYKVNSPEELEERLNELFKVSALVLAQEYLYTEYDWRIGVLNGRAIYACKYLMARNHWQIYNHNAKRFFSGDFETLPTFEVPKSVLQAAVKAARIIGNGLYGVDVKEYEGKAYVLEVNDNPSIDHKIEDAYLGDELYMQIMAEFQRRLESRGR